ncbi:MAG: sugar transferase [Roseburia sp.]|jgi:undecaprenyl phosphate N,N'-diacetylbacillosamine 1-phosphate transferase|nr:sugar transferase [Roseburia sp.]
MKKSAGVILSAVIGASAGAGVYFITKKKKNEAKTAGRHVPFGPYEAVFKRPLDILISGTALVLLSPVLGATALLVRAKLGSPVLFVQERPGRKNPVTGQERIFKIYKFRTMTDACGEDGELLPDEQRLTRFGKLLRSTSLDELPELFNILKGDMSLAGPRPLLPEYLPRYSEAQRHRHDVRPGLTGLAQVSGRNALSWEEKFEDDVRYVRHITFAGDLKILFQTVAAVVKKDGISSGTSATMETFTGNDTENSHKSFSEDRL